MSSVVGRRFKKCLLIKLLMEEIIYRVRKNNNMSQRELADNMQLLGLDIDKNAIQRIEAGKRFVTDIELIVFAEMFKITVDELLEK